ncbi:GatB/YqeY domain-containing protein [bacterium]|nr:GatB/YqeY domain-containing protein [bacterium]
MSLKETIQTDLKEALKEGRRREIRTLRMLLAAFQEREKAKRASLVKKGEQEKEVESLSEEEAIEVVFSEIKRRKEAIEEFKKGNREDLAQEEEKEIEVLKRYLPEQLSEEEIRKMVKEIIIAGNFGGIKDFGRVMKEIMSKVKGRAEGKLVSKIVKEILSQ